MPQEIALYNEFNIHETLHYFGLLHNMKNAEIKARSDFLIEFLDLPNRTRMIKNLRYVSNSLIINYEHFLIDLYTIFFLL